MGVSRIHKGCKGWVSAEYTKELKGGCQQNTQGGKGRVSAEYTKGVKGGCQQNIQRV